MGKKLPFEKEIGDLARATFPFVYRPLDVLGRRYTTKKPADFLCAGQDGGFVIVEAKATKSDRMPFSAIPDHQREALDAISRTTYGYAFLAINFRDGNGPGRAWLLPWLAWCEFESGWHKKSINKLEMCENFRCFELERIPGGWRVGSVDKGLEIWIMG